MSWHVPVRPAAALQEGGVLGTGWQCAARLRTAPAAAVSCHAPLAGPAGRMSAAGGLAVARSGLRDVLIGRQVGRCCSLPAWL